MGSLLEVCGGIKGGRSWRSLPVEGCGGGQGLKVVGVTHMGEAVNEELCLSATDDHIKRWSTMFGFYLKSR